MSNKTISTKKRSAGRPRSVSFSASDTGVSVFVRLDREIVDELDEMVAQAKQHPTLKHMSISRSTLIRASVEAGLGVWCKTQGLTRRSRSVSLADALESDPGSPDTRD